MDDRAEYALRRALLTESMLNGHDLPNAHELVSRSLLTQLRAAETQLEMANRLRDQAARMLAERDGVSYFVTTCRDDPEPLPAEQQAG